MSYVKPTYYGLQTKVKKNTDERIEWLYEERFKNNAGAIYYTKYSYVFLKKTKRINASAIPRGSYNPIKDVGGTCKVINLGVSRNKTASSNSSNKPKLSLLQTSFNELSKEKRKQLQSNLKDLGLYKSSIDGSYGKGTAAALVAYNKKYLNGRNLENNSYNTAGLIRTVLALKSSAVPVTTSSKNSKLKEHKEFCEDIGFTPKTESFGNCVLKLMEKD